MSYMAHASLFWAVAQIRIGLPKTIYHSSPAEIDHKATKGRILETIAGHEMQVRDSKEMEKKSEDEFCSKTLLLRIDTGLQQIDAWKSRLALREQCNTQLGYVYATSGRDKSGENWDGCIDKQSFLAWS